MIANPVELKCEPKIWISVKRGHGIKLMGNICHPGLVSHQKGRLQLRQQVRVGLICIRLSLRQVPVKRCIHTIVLQFQSQHVGIDQ